MLDSIVILIKYNFPRAVIVQLWGGDACGISSV